VRKTRSNLELTASDLSHFLGCRHRTALDLSVALGQREQPAWVDPVMLALRERGLDHERRYADSLRSTGVSVVDLTDLSLDDVIRCTEGSMRDGADVILQPELRAGDWHGRPDVLRRVDTPSRLGAWSYEVVDTKLAIETRGGTILQLALYSELLGIVQGAVPERFHVVTPKLEAAVQSFGVQEFSAYFRFVRSRLEATATLDPARIAAENYPEPVEHCEICCWRGDCDKRRRSEDHLSFVAGISRLQRRELEAVEVTTLEQLATLPLPLQFKPARGALDSYLRVREQARLQLARRTTGSLLYELFPIEPDQGLARLPVPSPGDVFLDLEGDPFAREGGREYLFGFIAQARDKPQIARSLWAYSDTEEREAFEGTVDQILALWQAHPDMHIYHYAPYEPAALKRLMGRYATREAELDRMLRAGLFVDLHSIVKHALRASVESYSIKELEAFYGFGRTVDLGVARTNLRVLERALELGATDAITDECRSAVEGYNRDDCMSALRLRDWLERLRGAVEADGTAVPRPTSSDGAASEKVDDRARRVRVLMDALTTGIPTERASRNEEQQGRWLLAHLLDWHRRESKAPWWEFFRLRDLSDEELLEEKAAISGLEFVERIGGTPRSPVDRYAFPLQDTEIRDGDELYVSDGKAFGKVAVIDRNGRTVDVKKRGTHSGLHPLATFAHTIVNSDVLADALSRIADDVVQSGLSAGTRFRAARELLLCRAPRLRGRAFEPRAGEGAVPFAVRVAGDLDETILAIQGPPGTGKTFTGAQMICELVRRGSRVGVTAVSHKVIRNLLDAAVNAASVHHMPMKCLHKVTTKSVSRGSIEEVTDNDEALSCLRDGRVNVVGGTPWLWSRPDAQGAVDVLFVDEAGQMSLANVLAASQSARSVVMLGDPQQLEQPQQGSHPEGADISALEHILGGDKTIAADRGIFLPETWRMHPAICAFTSEVFYEGRLHSRSGLERQSLVGTAPFEGAGLWVVGVAHDGNQNSSHEEVEAVDRIVSALLVPGAEWVDGAGIARAMSADDILVVAPYNSQVALLNERLVSRGVRVGTVDRFQGQQAPVVIYSMATSTPEDAPRGMEFLYSLNRLNVATSRARCGCILVACPRLFEPECRNPRQMQLANAICRYIEIACVAASENL
jgi:uncharacterized protein